MNPHTGKPASTTDPSTWGTRREVLGRINAYDGLDGVGFVFRQEDNIFGIDLDGVATWSDEGGCKVIEVPDWVDEILDLNETVIELSSSGTGLHIYALGSHETVTVANPETPGGTKRQAIEIYSSGRYFRNTFVPPRKGMTDVFGPAPRTMEIIHRQLAKWRGPEPVRRPRGDREYKPVTRAQVESALRYLDPDMPYPEWRDIGFAIHENFGGDDDGFDAFERWSSAGRSFEPGACERIWGSAAKKRNHSSPVTIGTLLGRAKDAGWTWHEGQEEQERATVDAVRAALAEIQASATKDVSTEVPELAVAPLDEEPYSWRDPRTLPLTPWLYGDKLLRGKASLLLAPGGVGKTFFTVASGLALASGHNLLHDHVFDRPQRVRFWSLEEDRGTLDRRLHAAALHYGLHGDDAVAGNLFVTTGQRTNIRIVRQGKHGEVEVDAPATDALIASLKRQRIDVLIVDPFVKSHAVGENDNGAIDVVVTEWNRIADEANCAVWLVHHTSKLRGDEANVESARGAKALADGVRAAHALNPMSERTATDYGLANHFGYLRCDNVKANYGRRTQAAEWYAFGEVDLGNGDLPVGVLTPFKVEGPPDLGAVDLDMGAVWADVERTGHRAENAQARDWIGHVLAQHLGADITTPVGKRAVREKLSAMIAARHVVVVDEQKNGRARKVCQRPHQNDNTNDVEAATA
ncbi:AAA family ATPase [Acuticoccus kandeliae]|uniref:AAA family ATPase n=1 Tax=Acuticoccus kandeliae TaxID=2073160 RepID=UPI001300B50D|nr:AAA family ATPase [Acuticoccus kandeliae]